MCPQCDVKWTTTHAISTCKDIEMVWKEIIERDVIQPKDIMQLDVQGKPSERYLVTKVRTDAKKMKKVATLTVKEIRILCAMKEVTKEVEYRAKGMGLYACHTSTSEYPQWKEKSVEQWMTEINNRRVENVKRRIEGKKEVRSRNLDLDDKEIG